MPEAERKAEKPAPKREPWIIRTYAGFGDARQANQRFHQNLKAGQKGLSIAFDLPTQNGYDPDAPGRAAARSARPASRFAIGATWRSCSTGSRSARSTPR